MTVMWNGADVLARVRAATVTSLVRGTEVVRAEMVSLITSGPKTGRVYNTLFYTVGTGPTRKVIAYGTRPPHQASAPGESPASDLGLLANSISTSVNAEALTGNVNVGAAYGFFLEYGTDRMEPRPFARPAVVNKRDEIVADIADEIGKALR